MPVAAIEVSLLADFGKSSAPSYAALLCTLAFHPQLLLGYQFKWFDLPMYTWVAWQVLPSVANGYGFYDGIAQTIEFAIVWALPYFMSRCYFSRPEHLKDIAVALVTSGLIYMPLCIFELRMSPCLHLWIYGSYPSPFFDMVRLGGYRPVVFMSHGLMLSYFMCSTAFIAGWLFWYRKTDGIDSVGPIPIAWAAFSLIPIAILTRSSGALLILAGLTCLSIFSRGGEWKWILLAAVPIMPIYIGLRISEVTDGRFMVDIVNKMFSGDETRAASLIARLAQEDTQVIKIRERPVIGWSNWSQGQDQLWLLLARNTGLPTVAAWIFVFTMPLVSVVASDLKTRRELLVYGVPLALVICGWVIDGLFNGMLNPMWPICSAAVMTAAWGDAASAKEADGGIAAEGS